jgi:hypothetical protein
MLQMAPKADKEREKIQHVEVKRRRVKAGGGYEPFWKVKDLSVALVDEDTEFRCKDCGGALKVFKSHKGGVPVAHAEHKDKADSEYCATGLHFKKATDGREARPSTKPVD